jgi:superfamily II DNA/RNA helicase
MFRNVFSRSSQSVWSTYQFSQLDLHPTIRAGLSYAGIVNATEIQSQSFVPVSSCRDTVICSATGTGKTLAYLVPVLNRIMYLKDHLRAGSSFRDLLNRSQPPIVVLAPSPELCHQIISVAQLLDPTNVIQKQWLSSTDAEKIPDTLTSGPRIQWGVSDLVVSTPSRFCEDMARFREENLRPSTIVVDEADYVLEGAMKSDITEIVNYLRPKRPRGDSKSQFIFASATIPFSGPSSAGSLIARRFPGAVTVRPEHTNRISSGIDSVEWIPELDADWEKRCELLTDLLRKRGEDKILVFVNSSRNCDLLFEYLQTQNFSVGKFKRGNHFDDSSRPIIVATDLAARGIDWKKISIVVNFQMPGDAVTWLHRAGRTGRVGNPPGSVISLYKAGDQRLVDELKRNESDLSKCFSKNRSLRRRMNSE